MTAAALELLPNYVRLERERKMKMKIFLRWELKNTADAKKRERQRLDLAHYFTTTAKPQSATNILASTQFFEYTYVVQMVVIFFIVAILCYLFYKIKFKPQVPDIPIDLIDI